MRVLLYFLLLTTRVTQGDQLSPPQVINSLDGEEAPVESPEAPAESPEAPVESHEAPVDGPEAAAISTTPSTPTVTPPTYHFVTVDGLGKARGVLLKSNKGRDVYSYLSLPYAEPPEGPRRFMNSEPWDRPWENETDAEYYDASWLRARCPQHSLIFEIAAGREDCLHLSVYTPLAPESVEGEGLPVMVWVHGGAYMTGDAFLYVPTKLMDRDVLVVVVQYRLGLFGFLAGGVAEAPGNMGLMDQIMALRWVQTYIRAFGGNPSLVTVFGQSAGGASTSWMLLTPLTQDTQLENNGSHLLHHAIPQSGSAFEEWTIDNDPSSSFQRTAEHLECWENGSTAEEAVACLVEKPFQDIVKAAGELYLEDRIAGGLGFRGLCPVVQKDMEFLDIDLVIPKDPRQIIADGEFLKIPVMSGSVRDEGSLVLGLSYTDYMVPLNITIDDEEFLKFDTIPMILGAFGVEDKTGSMASTMRLAYLPEAEMGDWYSMEGGLVDMGGVMFLKSGLWELVNKMYLKEPQSAKLFFYSWEFEADDSLFGWIFISTPDIPVTGGISHADELLYLFHLPADLDQRQLEMVDRMTLLWTNFATYGDPTPDSKRSEWSNGVEKWSTYTADVPSFMLVRDNFTMDVDFTTRWKYHSTKDDITEMPWTTPDMSSFVDQGDYDDMVFERDQFRIATGVLGGVTGCLMILTLVLVMKKMKKQNAIV